MPIEVISTRRAQQQADHLDRAHARMFAAFVDDLARNGCAALGSLFTVYLAGTYSSTMAGRLADRAGRYGILAVGVVVAIGGVALTLPASIWWIVARLIALTAGFFAAHSVASGWVGGRARVAHAQASALYLCLYYIGSSVAGSAGGVFWSHGGWLAVAAFAAALLAIALVSALSLKA